MIESLQDQLDRAGQFDWLRAELARFTYRPGWRLNIDAAQGMAGPSQPALTVDYEAANSYHPERVIPVKASFILPYPIALGHGDDDWPELFARWVQLTLFDIERHESREWLRRDGAVFDDPHA